VTGDLPPGTKVAVKNSTGHVLFYAVIAETQPPWVFWHRVVPADGYIDLPPEYDVVERS
jgi:hypothetical protein